MFKGYAKPLSTCLCVPAFVSKAPQMSLLPISHPVPAVSVSLPHFASRYRRCQPFATHAYSPWLPFVLVQLVHPTPIAHLPIPPHSLFRILFCRFVSCLSLFQHQVASHLDHFAWASIMRGPLEWLQPGSIHLMH